VLFGLRKDHLAGALIACIGGFAILESLSYGMGDLARVGSGVFPTAVGVLMILIGALIAGTAPEAAAGAEDARRQADWRGRGCVVAGPVLFVALGHWFGLAPATFACVFVAALGDREASLRSAALLAVGIAIIGIALFSYVLQVPFPILQWPDA